MRKNSVNLIGILPANRISACTFCRVTAKDGLALLVDFLSQNGRRPV